MKPFARTVASLLAAIAVALLASDVSVAAAPLATTGAASDITTSSAVLHGTVDPKGLDTQYSFRVADQTVDGVADSNDVVSVPSPEGSVSAGAGSSAVSATIGNLVPGDIYHVTLVAHEAADSVSGGDVTFATPPVAPTLSGPPNAPEVTDTSAILSDYLTLYGVPADFHFEYGATTSYGSVSPAPEQEADPLQICRIPQSTASAGTASKGNYTATIRCAQADYAFLVATLTGLTPGTTYHARLVAHNIAGPVASPDATFTTTGTPPTSSAPAQPRPASARNKAIPPRLVILTDSASVSRRGTVSLLVVCKASAGRCHDTVALSVVRHGAKHRTHVVTIARTRVNVGGGALAHVALALDRSGLRLLAHAPGRRLRVRASAGATHRVVVLGRSG